MADRIFDPQFPLPPIEDAKYSEEDRAGTVTVGETTIVDEVNPGGPLQLVPPSDITILEQNQYHAPDGTLLTDLVIDVQEVAGAANYEAKVTRL